MAASILLHVRKYLKKKIFWFIVTFIAAIILNFILPRMMPGDPGDKGTVRDH